MNQTDARLRILRSSQEGEHKSNRVCLIGLRGAGKSTLGQMVADDLDVPFIELNAVIAKEGGMPISEVIALYGEMDTVSLRQTRLKL